MTVALRRSWAKDLDARTLYELLKLRVEVFVDDPDSFISRAISAGATTESEIEVHQAPWGAPPRRLPRSLRPQLVCR